MTQEYESTPGTEQHNLEIFHCLHTKIKLKRMKIVQG
jgi:hypothetical protein